MGLIYLIYYACLRLRFWMWRLTLVRGVLSLLAEYSVVICWRGRMDDSSFFHYLSPFCFLLIEFHCTFSISYKILCLLNVILFWLGCDRPSGLLFFEPTILLSIRTPLFLPTSSVSLSYFILAVPMLVFGKTLVHEFPMSYSHTEWYLPFFARRIVCFGRSFVYQHQIKLN